MPLFKVYGKRYHRERSDYFSEVVRASSPKAALYRFALCATGVERIAEVQWYRKKPDKVGTGWFDPQPSFWVGDDEIYQVRKISVVTPEVVECPACRGSGTTRGYVEIEPPPPVSNTPI